MPPFPRPPLPLTQAHDIGESLQRAVEELDYVERAFVHLDTDWEHSRDMEHLNVYDQV
jgi:divalent metal cation (Fe/Co/Zn/Cd) transporter